MKTTPHLARSTTAATLALLLTLTLGCAGSSMQPASPAPPPVALRDLVPPDTIVLMHADLTALGQLGLLDEWLQSMMSGDDMPQEDGERLARIVEGIETGFYAAPGMGDRDDAVMVARGRFPAEDVAGLAEAGLDRRLHRGQVVLAAGDYEFGFVGEHTFVMGAGPELDHTIDRAMGIIPADGAAASTVQQLATRGHAFERDLAMVLPREALLARANERTAAIYGDMIGVVMSGEVDTLGATGEAVVLLESPTYAQVLATVLLRMVNEAAGDPGPSAHIMRGAEVSVQGNEVIIRNRLSREEAQEAARATFGDNGETSPAAGGSWL